MNLKIENQNLQIKLDVLQREHERVKELLKNKVRQLNEEIFSLKERAIMNGFEYHSENIYVEMRAFDG